MEIVERGQKALLTIHGYDYDGKVRADERKRKTGYIRRVYIQKGGRCSARTKSMSRMSKELLGDSKREKKHEKPRRKLLDQEDVNKV